MIVGHGIDAVEIARFAHWHTYPRTTLERIFSSSEIDYCLSTPVKSAERFAARFAAREALFKALCAAGTRMPFLTLCKLTTITKNELGAPVIQLKKMQERFQYHLSLSHTATTAFASVILSA